MCLVVLVIKRLGLDSDSDSQSTLPSSAYQDRGDGFDHVDLRTRVVNIFSTLYLDPKSIQNQC